MRTDDGEKIVLFQESAGSGIGRGRGRAGSTHTVGSISSFDEKLQSLTGYCSYGEDAAVLTSNPLLHTINVPSRLLRTNNVEILISTLNINDSDFARQSNTDRAQDALLVPVLQTPTSAGGGITTVRYPVHRALVVGQGISSAVAYGRFTAGQDISRDMVKVAINLPAPEKEQDRNGAELAIVETSLADTAVSKFREDIANSVAYEHGWFRSGLPTLGEWLAEGTSANTSNSMKPAIRKQIESLLEDANTNLTSGDAERLTALTQTPIPLLTTTALQQSIAKWAEESHTELRDALDIAFSAKSWRRIAWWKLLWRVDDVGMAGEEVLQRYWLNDAEKGVIWLAGRVQEAGYLKQSEGAADPWKILPEAEIVGAVENIAPLVPETIPGPIPHTKIPVSTQDVAVITKETDKPWPQHIPFTRTLLAQTTVPPFQALAQALLLQSLSTSAFSIALAGLLYVSFPTGVLGSGALFEAGAIASLGIVWSLRRLQRKWESAREKWEGDVREEGRKLLKDAEDGMKAVVERGSRPREVQPEGVRERQRAGEALERCRDLLARVEK